MTSSRSGLKCLLLALACVFFHQSSYGDESDKKMLGDARKCSDAMIAKDWESATKYIPPNFIEGVGGKAKMLELLKQTEAQMTTKGLSIQKVVLAEAIQKKEIKGTSYALIPQTITLKIPEGILTQKSYLLGISKDQGVTWYFMDSAQLNDENMMAMFPEIVGEIIIPKKEKPVFEKK